MKKTTKLILVLIWLSILWAITYASLTVANNRRASVSKLPWWWSWSGTTYDTAHDIGWPSNTYAPDSARFTGTLWAGNVITDTRTGLMWESIPNSWSTSMTWDNANIHCMNLTVWWYTDWRLPGIRELMSIVDYSRTDGANYWYASKFTLVATIYWSSTTSAHTTSSARYLNFDVGDTTSSGKTGGLRVICTR